MGISGSVMAQDTTHKAPSAATQAPPTNINVGNYPTTGHDVFTAVEVEPHFRGDFGSFLGRYMRYPAVEKMLGLGGRVFIQFVVERDGSLTEIKVLKARTQGFGKEAVRVLAMSPNWLPGIQNGKPVRVMYTVPINFTLDGSSSANISMKDLQKSFYGFVFLINGQIYPIDEAKEKLGNSFDSAAIDDVEVNTDPKYAMPDKRAVYTVKMKS
jgi:TonB family protein